MLGVEVLVSRRVVVSGANEKRRMYTVLASRKMQGRRLSTTRYVKVYSQKASRKRQPMVAATCLYL